MPARLVVRLTPSFQRDLAALPKASQEKVLDAVRRLDTNPSGPPPKIKKLKGKGVGQWRLEVWPYLVRYDILREEVALYRVRHRREISRD
jgi:mRNA-degrading endonuclease RelE of RelBE toxin-antitoxin system